MSEAENNPETAAPTAPPNAAMGLKRFHIVFIIASISVSVAFGVWGIRDYSHSESTVNLGLAIASLVVAAGLLVYGRWFLRKLKGLSV
jgi:hypothetical protein